MGPNGPSFDVTDMLSFRIRRDDFMSDFDRCHERCWKRFEEAISKAIIEKRMRNVWMISRSSQGWSHLQRCK